MLNLILAFVWTIVGGTLLALFYRTDENRFHLTILETRVSLGWLALLLAFYNVMRWWSGRSTAREQAAIAQAAERSRRGHAGLEEPVNPAFDFTDEPPRPNPSDRPPSPN